MTSCDCEISHLTLTPYVLSISYSSFCSSVHVSKRPPCVLTRVLDSSTFPSSHPLALFCAPSWRCLDLWCVKETEGTWIDQTPLKKEGVENIKVRSGTVTRKGGRLRQRKRLRVKQWCVCSLLSSPEEAMRLKTERNRKNGRKRKRELINMAWGRCAIPPIPSPTNAQKPAFSQTKKGTQIRSYSCGNFLNLSRKQTYSNLIWFQTIPLFLCVYWSRSVTALRKCWEWTARQRAAHLICYYLSSIA